MSCPDCFRGHEHAGEPRGAEIEIYGRPTYVTKPDNNQSAQGIIVIIPDGLGWKFVNTRLLADRYASRGQYTVYVPDFMDG